MRVKLLTLLATAVVGLGILPSVASASTSHPATKPHFASAPHANPFVFEPLVQSECPGSYICFWSGKTFGRGECESGQNCYSQFHGYEVGWHNLENINPQSMYNHTGEHLAWFPFGCCSQISISPGETYQWSSPYKGGFEIS